MSDNPPSPYLDEATWRHGSIITTFDKIPAPEVGIFDAPSVWVCVNTEWWSYLLERIKVLTRLDAWLGDETEQTRAAQEVEKLLAMANCEDCSEFITDIRVDEKGQLQKKVGGAWIPANGDGGDTTVINNIENINETLYPDPPNDPGISNKQKACNVASGIIEYMLAKFDDMLDLTDASIDTIAAADGILALFPPLYILSDQTTDLVNEIVEATTSALRALVSVSLKEDMICYLSDAIDTDGKLTETNYSDAIDSINDAITVHDTFGIGQPLKNTFGSISKEAFISRANLYQSQTEVCPCGDCYVNPDNDISFSAEDLRWILLEGNYDPDTDTFTSDPGGVIDVVFSLVRDADVNGTWTPFDADVAAIPFSCPFRVTDVSADWRMRKSNPPAGGSTEWTRRADIWHSDPEARISHWNSAASGGEDLNYLALGGVVDPAINDAFYVRLRTTCNHVDFVVEYQNVKITVNLPA